MGVTKVSNSKVDLPGHSGIGNGAIRSTSYDILLVFHYNYVSSEILSLIAQTLKKSHDFEHILFVGHISCMHTPVYQLPHEI